MPGRWQLQGGSAALERMGTEGLLWGNLSRSLGKQVEAVSSLREHCTRVVAAVAVAPSVLQLIQPLPCSSPCCSVLAAHLSRGGQAKIPVSLVAVVSPVPISVSLCEML